MLFPDRERHLRRLRVFLSHLCLQPAVGFLQGLQLGCPPVRLQSAFYELYDVEGHVLEVPDICLLRACDWRSTVSTGYYSDSHLVFPGSYLPTCGRQTTTLTSLSCLVLFTRPHFSQPVTSARPALHFGSRVCGGL